MLVGIGHAPVAVDARLLVLLEKDVVGAVGYNNELPRVVELMARGRIDVSSLISGVIETRTASRSSCASVPTGEAPTSAATEALQSGPLVAPWSG